MNKTKQEIFKLLLDLHKDLLTEQKFEYEKIYGEISDTNQYFQLVVGHEDFSWLRKLSTLIASFDEALESDDQDVCDVSKKISSLLSSDDDKDFYGHLKIISDNKPLIEIAIKVIIESLKNPA